MNKIVQLTNPNGDNIYPIAYNQGGMKMDLLWTNPSPSSSFASQIISLDLSNYTMVGIIYRIVASGTNVSHLYFNVIGDSTIRHKSSDGLTIQRTIVSISSTSIQFGDCATWTSYNTSSITTNNNYMVPYQIYGIKTSYIVPTEVQGLQYVEV